MVLGMACGIFGIILGECCRRYRDLGMDGFGGKCPKQHHNDKILLVV